MLQQYAFNKTILAHYLAKVINTPLKENNSIQHSAQRYATLIEDINVYTKRVHRMVH